VPRRDECHLVYELIKNNGLVKIEVKWQLPSGGGVQRKKRRVKPLASWVAMCALLFSPCVPVHGGLLKGDVDFSNYDAPLFEQIVNRIKAKVAARLGEGENTQDRYFIVPFAFLLSARLLLSIAFES
jgi:hypothetical protein